MNNSFDFFKNIFTVFFWKRGDNECVSMRVWFEDNNECGVEKSWRLKFSWGWVQEDLKIMDFVQKIMAVEDSALKKTYYI